MFPEAGRQGKQETEQDQIDHKERIGHVVRFPVLVFRGFQPGLFFSLSFLTLPVFTVFGYLFSFVFTVFFLYIMNEQA